MALPPPPGYSSPPPRLPRPGSIIPRNGTGNGTDFGPPYPPPAPPPYAQPPLADTIISGRSNEVTDNALRSAVIINTVIGAVCLLFFVLFQSRSVLYKFRLVSDSVTSRPPPLLTGVSSLWSWLLSTLVTSDQDLLQSCGLDAFMFVKMLTYGVHLFTPIAFLGLTVLLPVHMTSDFLRSDPSFGNQANFMRTTMTNVPPRDRVLWLHCVFVLLFIAWGCWLLKWHFHQYVTIRQHWLRTGDKPNKWRPLYEAKQHEEEELPSAQVAWKQLLSKVTQVTKEAAQKLNPLSSTTPPASSETVPSHGAGDADGGGGEGPAAVTHSAPTDAPPPGSRAMLRNQAVRYRGSSDPGAGPAPGASGDNDAEARPSHSRSLAHARTAATLRQRGSMRRRDATAQQHAPSSLARISASSAATSIASQQPPRSYGPLGAGVLEAVAAGGVRHGSANLKSILEQELGLRRPSGASAAGGSMSGPDSAVSGGARTGSGSGGVEQRDGADAGEGPGSGGGGGVLGRMVEGGRGLMRLITARPRPRTDDDIISEDPAGEAAALAASTPVAADVRGRSVTLSVTHQRVSPRRGSSTQAHATDGGRRRSSGVSARVSGGDHHAHVGDIEVVVHSACDTGAAAPTGGTVPAGPAQEPAADRFAPQAPTPAQEPAATASQPAPTIVNTTVLVPADPAPPPAATGVPTPPTGLGQQSSTQAGVVAGLSEGVPEAAPARSCSLPYKATAGAETGPGLPPLPLPHAHAHTHAGGHHGGKHRRTGSLGSPGAGSGGGSPGGSHGVSVSVSGGGLPPLGHRGFSIGGSSRRDEALNIIQTLKMPEHDSELPQWWSSTKMHYDPQAVASQRQKSRHRRSKSSGRPKQGSTGSPSHSGRHHLAGSGSVGMELGRLGSDLTTVGSGAGGAGSSSGILPKFANGVLKVFNPNYNRIAQSQSQVTGDAAGTGAGWHAAAAAAAAAAAGLGSGSPSVSSPSGVVGPHHPMLHSKSTGAMHLNTHSLSTGLTGSRSNSSDSGSDSSGSGSDCDGERVDAAAGGGGGGASRRGKRGGGHSRHSSVGREAGGGGLQEALLEAPDVQHMQEGSRHDQHDSQAVVGWGSHDRLNPAEQGEEEEDDGGGGSLARPSVSYLKTVNTINKKGQVVSVQAQQYAVLVTDVNQNLWTGQELWEAPRREEGQGVLSALLPQWARTWVMSNYAVQALDLFDNSSDEEELDREFNDMAHSNHHEPTETAAETAAETDDAGGTAGRGGADSGSEAVLHLPPPPLQLDSGGVVAAGSADRPSGGGGARRSPNKLVLSGGDSGAAGPAGGSSIAHQTHSVYPDSQQPTTDTRATGTTDSTHVQQQQQQSPLHVTAPPWPRTPHGPVVSSLIRVSPDRRPHGSILGPNPPSTQHNTPSTQHSAQHSMLHGSDSPGRPVGEGEEEPAAHTAGLVTEVVGVEHVTVKVEGGSGGGQEGLLASQEGAGAEGVVGAGASKAGDGPASKVGAGVVAGEEEESAVDKERRMQGARRKARERWRRVRQWVREGAVAQLPLDARRYSVVTATFMRLFPHEFDRAIPVFNHKRVDLLLFELDRYTNAYMQAEFFSRLRNKPAYGRLKWFGPRVDLLKHYQQQITRINNEIKDARKEAVESGNSPSWLVFFKTQTAAAMCAQAVIHSEDNREFKVQPAPGPEEVNWPALWMNYKQRDARSTYLVYPLLLLLTLVPVGIFTGAVMQLEFVFCPVVNCRSNENPTVVITERGWCPDNTSMEISDAKDAFRWEWYCRQDNVVATFISRALTGWLPSLLLMLWQNMVLPLVMLLLAQASGRCFSYSMMDQLIAQYIFWFNLFQSFIGGILGSALMQQINQLFSLGPGQGLEILGTFLPSSSNFFVAYMLLRTLALLPLKLLTPHIGIRMYLFRRYLFRCSIAPLTPREEAFFFAPTSPRIGFEYGMTLLMFLIPMTFAVLAPIVPVVGLGYFAFSWVVWRYLYLYIFVRKYESGGLMWQFVYSRMLIVFGVFGLFTACVMIVKEAYAQAILLFVLVPLMVYHFHHFIYFRFLEALGHVPLTLACHAPPAPHDIIHQGRMTSLASCYIPPPLTPGSLGWHPEWCKPWQGWMLPTGYCVT